VAAHDETTGSGPGGSPEDPNASAASDTPPIPGVARPAALRWAWTTFGILFFMHLLDYADRWALTGVMTLIQPDLGMNDSQAGTLNMWFLATFTLVSPLMGYLGDRTRRTWLLAAGVGLWSLATVGTGLVKNYEQLRYARALLGVGEATYGVIAPTLLMDLFRRQTRARVLSLFYLAMPFGYAIGVTGGRFIADASPDWFGGTSLEPWVGWRMAFFVVGAPGLLAAFFVLLLPEPIRGSSEEASADRVEAHHHRTPTKEDYQDLLVTSSYAYVVFGLAMYTFAFGGLAFWLAPFLERVKEFEPRQATLVVAGTVLVASIVGMTSGGILADLLSKKNPRAMFLVPGFAMLLAVPFTLAAIISAKPVIVVGGLLMAATLMLSTTGPCNAIIANVVSPNLRASAYAIAVFVLHMLGDLWSPWIMGQVSDYAGDPEVMATGFGSWLAWLNAIPVRTASGDLRNLSAGMLVVVPALALGGIVLLAGARHLPREMALMLAKLRSDPDAKQG
jgi:MFS family permease